MKTKNFPAKKLKRQLKAQGKELDENLLTHARGVKTKKKRGEKKK